MNPKEIFQNCLDLATSIVKQVEAAQYTDPTPCTEWNVKQLANHMLYELAWVPDILAGKTVADVGSKYDGDLIKDDLQTSWQEIASAASKSAHDVELTSTIHLSFGDFSAEYYLLEQANDQLIHGWDLATAIGIKVTFDAEVAQRLYQALLPKQAELVSSGLFEPAIAVSDDADIQTKLLAIQGRSA